MKAFLKNYRQSPRKVRLVADFVRGKKVENALQDLQFMPKRASLAISKLISSARANAVNNFKVTEGLMIKEITVDDGPTLKRHRPVSRGRAHPINKRTSHVNVVLAVQGEKKAKKSTGKAPETKKQAAKKAPVKKTTAKKPEAKKTATKTANKDNA
jgi:large subunit ribosomal protein L22